MCVVWCVLCGVWCVVCGSYIDVEIELETSSDGNIEHWCGQGGGVCIVAVLGTHVQEVAIVVLLGMIVDALLREVSHGGDHPPHVGEVVLLPAAGVPLELTVGELVSSWRGGRGGVWPGRSYPSLGGLGRTVFSQVVVEADGVQSGETCLVVVVGVEYLEDKSVGLEADLSSPPFFIILKPAVWQVPDVVNVAFVTLGIDLEVGYSFQFLNQ